jgi:hypothetical protein
MMLSFTPAGSGSGPSQLKAGEDEGASVVPLSPTVSFFSSGLSAERHIWTTLGNLPGFLRFASASGRNGVLESVEARGVR